MKESLQQKVDLLKQNSETVMNSAKLDFGLAANLGALLFTSENLVASEAEIRANREILKAHAGAFSNLRGAAVNLSLLSRMSIEDDAEAYLEKVMSAYDIIKGTHKFAGEELVLAAMTIVEDTDPADYAAAAEAAWAVIEKMKETHPTITNSRDLAMAHLVCSSGADVDALLKDADDIFAKLEPTGFKLNKDALQSISILLAMSDKPTEEKCARFTALREKLRNEGHKITGSELAVLAAFANTDIAIDEAAAEIAEVDDALSHVHGFGALTTGANLRRMYAATLVLQAYGDEHKGATSAASNAAINNIAETVIFAVIMAIILMVVICSCMMTVNAGH